MKFLAFVYGTLKTGEPNFRLMKEGNVGLCILKGQARTVHKFPLVIASRYHIPFMLGVEGKGHNILGEVYEVDETQQARLDQLENHPNFYERQEIDVEMINGDDKGTTMKAMAYMLVKFKPQLLDLPMLDNYTDLIDGKKYVGGKDRDIQTPLWWYEVHTRYSKPSNAV